VPICVSSAPGTSVGGRISSCRNDHFSNLRATQSGRDQRALCSLARSRWRDHEYAHGLLASTARPRPRGWAASRSSALAGLHGQGINHPANRRGRRAVDVASVGGAGHCLPRSLVCKRARARWCFPARLCVWRPSDRGFREERPRVRSPVPAPRTTKVGVSRISLRWGRPAGLDVRPGDFSSPLADSRATEAERCPVRFSIGASSVCVHRGGRS
jgi:hypothetical protein